MKTKNTFYIATKAVFRGCKRPQRKPDYRSIDRNGWVSSEYWYTPRGVIRCSNHWSKIDSYKDLLAFKCGKVATCHWVLINCSHKKGYTSTPCGFCPWDEFKDN